ncbi:hypothetical protein ACJ73_03732 [Blastomyces percursus]|uniref:PBSP domain-containing protein n=1 Tax=Blastomyces percursus TaxID=1658174 RepID=A0A1J9RA87_9EURO|nr:hypothetical protein ACJ73_03732 [Blastomyces percursus]
MSSSFGSSVQLTPSSSPIPYDSTNKTKDADSNEVGDAKQRHKAPHSPPQPTPKLRLHLQDLTHPATKSFINLISDPNAAINTALANIVTYLYTSPPKRDQSRNSSSNSSHAARTHPHFNPSLPATRSVTFIIRDMPGVAYTTGTQLDSDHKEIHFSLSYIATVSNRFVDATRELLGVITHELVHCYQHTRPQARVGPEELKKKKKKKKQKDKSGPQIPNPPSGLIEGIADFVRLKAGLVPPHWERPMSKAERGGRWDQGYQITAFFLEWIEDVKVGEGAVGMLNDRLLRVGYVGESDGNGDNEDHGDNGEDGDDGEDTDDGGDEDDGDNGEGGQEEAGAVTDDEDLAKCGFWRGLFGADVLELWEQYGEYLDALKLSSAKSF